MLSASRSTVWRDYRRITRLIALATGAIGAAAAAIVLRSSLPGLNPVAVGTAFFVLGYVAVWQDAARLALSTNRARSALVGDTVWLAVMVGGAALLIRTSDSDGDGPSIFLVGW